MGSRTYAARIAVAAVAPTAAVAAVAVSLWAAPRILTQRPEPSPWSQHGLEECPQRDGMQPVARRRGCTRAVPCCVYEDLDACGVTRDGWVSCDGELQ